MESIIILPLIIVVHLYDFFKILRILLMEIDNN